MKRKPAPLREKQQPEPKKIKPAMAVEEKPLNANAERARAVDDEKQREPKKMKAAKAAEDEKHTAAKVKHAQAVDDENPKKKNPTKMGDLRPISLL